MSVSFEKGNITMDTKKLRVAIRVLQFCIVLMLGLLAWLFAGPPKESTNPVNSQPEVPTLPTEPASAALSSSPLEKQWGIQVTGIALTNEASSVRVSYTITDPEKTLPLGETDVAVYLVNEANGAKLPMIAPPQQTPQGATMRTTRRMMRQAGRFPPTPSRLMTGRLYSLDIPNWGQSLETGSKVSLVIGAFRQGSLIVE